MKSVVTNISVVLIVLFTGTISAFGVPSFGHLETWSTIGDMDGWLTTLPPASGAASVGVDAALGQNAVHIAFGVLPPMSPPNDENVYATSAASGAGFVGDYSSGIMSVAFKLYAADTPPGALSVFFQSTGIDNRTWMYNLTPGATLSWNTYNVPMSWATGWALFSGDSVVGTGETEFNADLVDVDRLGIWITQSSSLVAQNYGLDDFSLFIPEPSTYVILAFAILSLGLMLHRKQMLSFELVRMSKNR